MWVSRDWILSNASSTDLSWRKPFDGMVEHRATRGWVSSERDYVRAHIGRNAADSRWRESWFLRPGVPRLAATYEGTERISEE